MAKPKSAKLDLVAELEAKIAELHNVAHMFYVNKIRDEALAIIARMKNIG